MKPSTKPALSGNDETDIAPTGSKLIDQDISMLPSSSPGLWAAKDRCNYPFRQALSAFERIDLFPY